VDAALEAETRERAAAVFYEARFRFDTEFAIKVRRSMVKILEKRRAVRGTLPSRRQHPEYIHLLKHSSISFSAVLLQLTEGAAPALAVLRPLR